MWLTTLRGKRATNIGRLIIPYLSQKSRVIDVGCGRGYITEYLREHSASEIVGVDIVNRLEVDIPFNLYDGTTLPFKDKEFDLGLLIFVLHHAGDEHRLLSEAQRVSREILIMEDVYSNLFGYLFTIVMDFVSNLGGGSIKFRKIGEWKKIFSEHNLKIVGKKELLLGTFGSARHCLFLLSPA